MPLAAVLCGLLLKRSEQLIVAGAVDRESDGGVGIGGEEHAVGDFEGTAPVVTGGDEAIWDAIADTFGEAMEDGGVADGAALGGGRSKLLPGAGWLAAVGSGEQFLAE